MEDRSPDTRAAARDRNILRVLGLLVSAVTVLLGFGLFAHTRHLGVSTGELEGVGARLAAGAPRLGEALALVVLWTCAVLAASSATLAVLARPWRLAVHFGAGAGFASAAFAVAGWLAYGVAR